MMSLSDWGRWRSPSSLEWLNLHGMDNVPTNIRAELHDLCSEHDASQNDQPSTAMQGRRNRWR